MMRKGRGVGQILALMIIMLSALEEQGSRLFFWGGGVFFNYLRMILLQKELLQLNFLADIAH